MELLETAANEMLATFEKNMGNRINSFKSIPEQYSDFLPEARSEKIRAEKEKLLSGTLSFLLKMEEQLKPKFDEVEKEISKKIFPLRTAGSAAGEAQFQSALAVVNSKNENLILGELEKSLATNRIDYSFSIIDLLSKSDMKEDFKIKAAELFRGNPIAEDYDKLLTVKNKFNEIKNQIGFYKRQISNGSVPDTYKINRAFRVRNSEAAS